MIILFEKVLKFLKEKKDLFVSSFFSFKKRILKKKYDSFIFKVTPLYEKEKNALLNKILSFSKKYLDIFNDNLNKKVNFFASLFKEDKPLFKKTKVKKYRIVTISLPFGVVFQFRVLIMPKKILNPFKSYSQQVVAILLIFALIIPYFFFRNPDSSLAATYTWVQTDWSGGTDGGTYPDHDSNQTGWTKYSSKNDWIIMNSGSSTLSASGTTESIAFTTEGNYVQEDATNGTDFGGGVLKIHGTVASYSEDLVPTMTSNTAPSGTASAESNDSTAYRAFNGGATNWTSGAGFPHWLAYEFTSAQTLNKYRINCGYSGGMSINYCPSHWTFEGTNNGVDWTTLDTETDSCDWVAYQYSDFTFDNSESFTKYRVNITDNCDYISPSSTTIIEEMEWMSAATYTYATSQPYYVTTGNSSNIDTSNWGSVSSTSFTETTPDNTNIKYLVSFDGRTTWKYWNDSVWATSSLANLQTDGMSSSTISSLSSIDWSSSGGFIAGSTDSLDFAMDLSSSDSSVTPELDNISITGSTLLPGTSKIKFTTEGNYTQEDSASGTDFASGIAKLNARSITYTDDQCNDGTATQSSYMGGYPGSQAFVTGLWLTCWISSGNAPQWLAYEFTSAKTIAKYVIRPTMESYISRTPKDWTLEGSNNGTDWTVVDTRTSETSWTQNTPRTFTFSNSDSYTRYRLNISDTLEGAYSNIQITEVEMMEDIYTYATSQPYYIATNDSSNLSTSAWSNISGVSFTETTPDNTNIKYLVSFDGRTTWKYWNGSSWSSSSLGNFQTDGMSSSTLAALTSNNWLAPGGFVVGSTDSLDFAMDLSSSDSSATPELNEISVSYDTKPSASFISSAYDARSTSNLFSGISWNSTLPNSSTTVKFQVRTAPDDGGSPGTWTDWCGPNDADSSTTTCDTHTFFTSSDGSQSVDEAFSDGVDDQWIQYKATLETSDVSNVPTLNDVTMTYVVNSPPNFDATYETNGVGVTFSSSTVTTISYKARDIDTNTGTAGNQYKIWPTFEYSTTSGSSWVSIATSSLISGPTGDDASYITLSSTSTYVTTSTVWNANSMIDGVYSTTTQIRVTLDDHEAANNTVTATSSIFILDTKDPTVGTPTGGGTGINVNQNVLTSQSNDKASSTSATLYLSSSDDSTLQMMVSESSDFSGASYESYSATKAITLSEGDGTKTVYAKFKDQYGNITSSYNDTVTLDMTAPDTPSSLQVQDISNSSNSEYRIFISWTTSVASDFKSYDLYRSTNGSDFSLLQTITDIGTNYIIDTGLSEGTTYYYKLTVSDDIGNTSSYTTTRFQTAGGNPSDFANPVISSVATSSLGVSSVTITWTTDEVSDTNVLYSTDESYGSTQGTSGYSTSHSVKLVGLTAETTYNFKARSIDASGNSSLSSAYSFTTSAGDSSGPSISDISSGNITASEATITWTTDEDASSFVEYSTEDGFSSGTIFGDSSLATSHSITLPKVLSSFTNYYFKVRSTDSQGNETVSSQGSFVTLNSSSDTTAPTIFFSCN
jgi:hypothetical protein